MTKSNTKLPNFPNPTLSKEEKSTKKYGLGCAKAIYGKHRGTDWSVYNKIAKFVENRKAAEGLSSVDKFKDLLDLNGDTSYLNLDWQSISVIPKFVQLVVGEMINQEFKVNAVAMDESSMEKFEEEKNKIYANMLMAEFSQKMEAETGFSLVDKSIPVPKDLEEADVLIETTLKQAVEIAMEVCVSFVLRANNFDKEVKERLIRDLVVIKICATRTYFDDNNDIKVRYVDPANLVLPYSKDPYFRDTPYTGEILKMSFHDFVALVGDEMTDEQYYDIAKRVGKKDIANDGLTQENGRYYQSPYYGRGQVDDFYIEVLDFEIRSTNHELTYEQKYISKGNFFLNKKKTGYEPKKYSKKKREVTRKKVEVFYEGLYVIGSDYIYKYGLQENMNRPKKSGAYCSEVKSRYSIIAPGMYDMENKSMVEQMLPFDNQMTLAYLKLQQQMIKARPAGLAVDSSSLEDVLKGRGEDFLDPTDIVEIFDQTGNLYYRSEDSEFGGMINQKPIQELANGLSPSALYFVEVWNHNLNMIRTITGLNEARDGSTPSSKALVGVQKMAVNMSRNVTRSLNDAYIYSFKSLADNISMMVQNKAVADGLRGYELALGKEVVDVVNIVKSLTLAELGIEIEILPTAEDMQELNILIEKAITAQSIELEDAMEVKDVAKVNIKKATHLLKKRRKEKQESDMAIAANASQQNAQAQMQSQQSAAQSEMQLKQMEHQMDMEKLQMEYQLKMQLEQMKARTKGMADAEVAMINNDEKLKQIDAAKKNNIDDTSIGNSVREPQVFRGVGDSRKLD
tara:strand:- start:314 stop:2698 length:2385 start_codon:yes stop_codon:yes gene_type:complete